MFDCLETWGVESAHAELAKLSWTRVTRLKTRPISPKRPVLRGARRAGTARRSQHGRRGPPDAVDVGFRVRLGEGRMGVCSTPLVARCPDLLRVVVFHGDIDVDHALHLCRQRSVEGQQHAPQQAEAIARTQRETRDMHGDKVAKERSCSPLGGLCNEK